MAPNHSSLSLKESFHTIFMYNFLFEMIIPHSLKARLMVVGKEMIKKHFKRPKLNIR